MPSQALVQERRTEEVLLALPGITIVVDSRIENISLCNTGKCTQEESTRPFDFDVDLTELSRNRDGIRVGFSFSFGRPSSGQACKVAGEAVVRFSRFNLEHGFQYLGDDLANEIAVEIFRRNYELIYLLHESLAMDAPSPWITQNVALSLRTEEICNDGR